MKNIVKKCTDYKGRDTASKMHINDKEINMIKSIIHRGETNIPKIERDRKANKQSKIKYVTLDELIDKNNL